MMRVAMLTAAIFAAIPRLAVAAPVPPPADPLTASIHTEDVNRFAKVFAASNGRPSADQLEAGYIAPGSYGVTVFTPDRIVDAGHLASAVLHDPTAYETAIRTCLPRLAAAEPDLRAIYLALHGLLPDEPLPQI